MQKTFDLQKKSLDIAVLMDYYIVHEISVGGTL